MEEVFNPFKVAKLAKISKLDAAYNYIMTPLAGYTHGQSVPLTKEAILTYVVQTTIPDYSNARPYFVHTRIEQNWIDPSLPEGQYRIPKDLLPEGQDVIDLVHYGYHLSQSLTVGGVPRYVSNAHSSLSSLFASETQENLLLSSTAMYFRHPDLLVTEPAVGGLLNYGVLLSATHPPDLSSLSHAAFMDFRLLMNIDVKRLLKPYYKNVLITTPYGEIPLSDSDEFNNLDEARGNLLSVWYETFFNQPEIPRIL